MQKGNSRKRIDLVMIIIMLFGWIAMLSAGFGSADSESSEGSEASGAARFNPLRYGFYIFGIATLVLVFVSQRRAFNGRLFMGIIIFALFSLCQPFTMALYRCGFQTLLVGTLAFIIISHMKIETQSAEHTVISNQ